MEEHYIMVRAVVGANWGDEGKGKITDMLGQESDIIVRFQGGANAVSYTHLDVYKRQEECSLLVYFLTLHCR